MKRLAAALLLFLVPGVAFAFDTNRRPADEKHVRIGILHADVQYERGRESSVQELVLRSLRTELRERGFDAFDAEMTYDDAQRREADADYLVEVIGGESYSDDYGGVGIGDRNADVTLAVIASRVAGQLRIYDAHTMELLATKSIARRSTAILPTSVGLGGREVYAVVALPFVQWAQSRRVAHAAAHEAAALVASTVRGE
jgi:hypothetical protein